MKTYVFYTTSNPGVYQDRVDKLCADWSKTKGRGKVRGVVKRVRVREADVVKDKKGVYRLSWEWFNKTFPRGKYDGVIFHFTPYYRTRFGISWNLNGGKNTNNKDYPEFWLCCDKDDMAKGYKDLTEFERLCYHEHGHFDEDLDNDLGNVLTQDSVHKVDYELKQIHLYHLLIDYRGQAIKEKVNAVVNSIIKLAKRII